MNSDLWGTTPRRARPIWHLLAFFAPLLLLSVPANGAESAKTLFDQIAALDDTYSACARLAVSCGQGDNKSCESPSCNTGNVFLGGDTAERDVLIGKLKTQYSRGDLVAAFYWGYVNWQDGLRVSDASTKLLQDYQAEKYRDAYAGFLRASQGGVGEGSWNIAVMYEEGNGLKRSKLAAAEWYAKAGRQHLKDNDRELALAALERVEAIDAKHPEAIKLRSLLYPSRKQK